MADALFLPEDDLFFRTELARRPWTEDALHAGPPGAPIARAIAGL